MDDNKKQCLLDIVYILGYRDWQHAQGEYRFKPVSVPVLGGENEHNRFLSRKLFPMDNCLQWKY